MTRFTPIFIQKNGLDQNGFDRWAFCPGMQFGSPDKWWGDRGPRDFPHEGIDLCLYRDHARRTHRLDEKTRIPVMFDGVVKAIFKDFLGEAVIIEHRIPAGAHDRLLSIYAHTRPNDGIQIGTTVKEGDILATIADTFGSKSKIIPHLHLSLGVPSPALSYDFFVWNTIRKPDMITLMDPLQIIDWPYHEFVTESPFCSKL